MEGVLWERRTRGKLLRGWLKRYFVLSEGGSLRVYAASSSSPAVAPASPSPSHSGMSLERELSVRGASVKTLPLPLAGRQHAFQLSTTTHRMVLSARSPDELRRWVAVVRRLSKRPLPLPSPLSPSSQSDSSSASSKSPSPRSSRSAEPPDEDELDHFVDVVGLQRSDMAQLSAAYSWVNDCRVKTARAVRVGVPQSLVPRGALLIAVSGVSIQTLTPDEIRRVLLEASAPVPSSLRFLRSPSKRGILRAKLSTGAKRGLAAQLKTRLRDWSDQFIELDGDVLTCAPVTSKADRPKRVLPLSAGCVVRPVHELVADRKLCFVVAARANAVLFQAESESERRSWIAALRRAIAIAEGCVPALDRGYIDALQHMSALNMRHQHIGEIDMDDEVGADEVAVFVDMTDASGDVEGEAANSSAGDEVQDAVVQSPSPVDRVTLPADELADSLLFLQTQGRFVEALQLMGRNAGLRSAYWRKIFGWAVGPANSATTAQEFAILLEHPLSDADAVQVQKDVPRTSKWLAGAAGAPDLDADQSQLRLSKLERVLHAFVASCALDDAGLDGSKATTDKSYYMQGMNGIAFILLEVLEDDEVAAFEFLRALVVRVLPHVFGATPVATSAETDTLNSGGNADHFDLFGSLVEVGDVLQDVAKLHVPLFHEALERAGIPVCLLAYKWFPTLFSDLSLTAFHSQLRLDTLLAIWDTCLLLGLEGLFSVALALCGAAEDAVTALGVDASAEQLSWIIGNTLARVPPDDLLTGVCEVLELGSHPVLLKLRNAHRRRLQLGYAREGLGFSEMSEPPQQAAMTVTDLDSGRTFAISAQGGMLLPHV